MTSQGGARGLTVGLVVAGLCVLLAAGAIVRWVAEREARVSALPRLEGRLALPGLSARIVLVRDAHGGVVVTAATDAGAWTGLGFVHAQDRLGQMLWLRRLARGRTAEVVGEAGLPADRLTRTLGLGRWADATVEALDPALRQQLDAYTQGINLRLARIRGGEAGLPLAVVGWGVDELEDWRASDCLAVYKLVSWASGGALGAGVVLSDLIERLGGLGARPFFPAGPQVPAITVPVTLPPAAVAAEPRATSAGDKAARNTLIDVPALEGSAWVIAAAAAAGGAPLLGAELTLAATAPALVHEARLHGAELRVYGAAVPGVPVFWAGRNDDVAWAVTLAGAVSRDLYIESLRPSKGGRYHDGGRWLALDGREEQIRVRDPLTGQVREESLEVRVTGHGPLVNRLLPGSRAPLALAWTGAQRGDGLGPLARLAHAETAADVVVALEQHVDPAVSVAYADRHGAAGVQVAGWLPQRMLPTSLVPVPGRMRAFSWSEPVAFDALPSQRIDPAAVDAEQVLWLRTADEPRPEGTGGAKIEWLWRSGVRAARLDTLLSELAAAGSVTAPQAAGLHADRMAPRTRPVAEAIRVLAGSPRLLGAGAAEVLQLVVDWDGRFEAESRGALAYRAVVGEFGKRRFAQVVGSELLAVYDRLPGADVDRLAEAVLVAAAAATTGRSGGAGGSWADPATVAPMLRDSLRRTSVQLGYRLGPNRSRWSWGRLHQLGFRPFHEPDAGATVLGPWPVGGGDQTLDRSTSSDDDFAVERIATFRFVADLSRRLEEPAATWSVLAPGQSEHPDHGHYASGVAALRDGRPLPLAALAELEASDAATRLVLVPAP